MILLSPSELISLHIIEPLHGPDLFKLIEDNRSHLEEFLPWISGATVEQDIILYIEYCLGKIAADKGLQLMIFEEENMIGSIGFYEINKQDRKANINYWLINDYVGKGIITQSCKAIINYGFEELKLNRLEIRCATENTKSQAVPERLGFIKEGKLRSCEWLNNRFVDHFVYSMLKEEWQG